MNNDLNLSLLNEEYYSTNNSICQGLTYKKLAVFFATETCWTIYVFYFLVCISVKRNKNLKNPRNNIVGNDRFSNFLPSMKYISISQFAAFHASFRIIVNLIYNL